MTRAINIRKLCDVVTWQVRMKATEKVHRRLCHGLQLKIGLWPKVDITSVTQNSRFPSFGGISVVGGHPVRSFSKNTKVVWVFERGGRPGTTVGLGPIWSGLTPFQSSAMGKTRVRREFSRNKRRYETGVRPARHRATRTPAHRGRPETYVRVYAISRTPVDRPIAT